MRAPVSDWPRLMDLKCDQYLMGLCSFDDFLITASFASSLGRSLVFGFAIIDWISALIFHRSINKSIGFIN